MSLYKKLVLTVGLLCLVILSLTLFTVYETTQSMMIDLAQQKAISVIKTIDSALESGIPDFEFESILLHLKAQDHEIRAFDIYKLTGYLYDIASTDKKRIGSQATPDSKLAVERNTMITSANGQSLRIVAPIHVNGQTVYAASVTFSLVNEMSVINKLMFDVFGIGLLAVVVALTLIGIFVRRLVSRPILAMVDTVRDVASGKLVTNLQPYCDRHDDIGDLARNIDVMVTTLNQLISGIALTSSKMSTSFSQLVIQGDQTVRGALHIADVLGHVEHNVTVNKQVTAQAIIEVKRILSMIQDACILPSSGRIGDALQLKDTVASLEHHLAPIMDRTSEMHTALLAIGATDEGQLKSMEKVRNLAQQLSYMALTMRDLLAQRGYNQI